MLNKLINFFKILFSKKKITIKFGVVGIMTYLIYLGFLIILIEIFSVKEIISSIISNIIAIIVNFVLLKVWVFKVKRDIKLEFFKYNIVSLTGFCLNNFFFWVLVEKLHFHYLLSQIFLFFIVATSNFILNYLCTFKNI